MHFLDVNASVLTAFAVLLGVALLVSAAGFIRVVYFVSLGYAFSIAAMVPVSLWLYRDHVDALGLLQAGLLLLYALRLGLFLLARERSPAYRRELEEVEQRGTPVRGLRRVMAWLGVSLLYPLMFLPTLLVLAAGAAPGPASSRAPQWVGIGVMALGLTLEALADHQKSRFKAAHPTRYCDQGLYRVVRCPNYLGEMLFWLGHWVAGLVAYAHPLHWAASLAGLLCIQLVMLGSTRRLELKQDERYGDDADYQRYARSVPVLLPLLPVYSLRRWKLYLG